MASLLSGTKLAIPHSGATLNARAGLHTRDICDEDCLSVDDLTESRLKGLVPPARKLCVTKGDEI